MWMQIEGETSVERQEGAAERVSALVSHTLGFKSRLFHQLLGTGCISSSHKPRLPPSAMKLLACAIVNSMNYVRAELAHS